MENDSMRLFIASSELFSDFSVQISLYDVSSLEEIIEIFKKELISVLQKNNFTRLIQIVKKANFHIHSYSIEDILTSKKEDVFYICDHC